MPDESGVTVVTMLVCFLFCMRGCGRVERPAFPAPSFSFGRNDSCITRANSRRGNAEACASLFELEPPTPRHPGQASESERRSGIHNHRCPRPGQAGATAAQQLRSVVMG